MRVYNLSKEEFALQNIQKKRIKISLLDDLNDPFELLGTELPDEEHRSTFSLFKKTVSESHGVICFSKSWHNPLMWSHYADKHKGICLGFDIDDDLIKEIKYIKKKKDVRVDLSKKAGGITADTIEEIMRYKYSDWSYENEVRAWADLDSPDENGLYFMDFEDNLVLREIIIGPRCELTAEDIISNLPSYDKDIKIIKSRLAFNSFKVVRKKDVAIKIHSA